MKLTNGIKTAAAVVTASSAVFSSVALYKYLRDSVMQGHIDIPFKGVRPVMGHLDDAGSDLVAQEDVFIPAGEHAVVSTGTFISLPRNAAGMIFARSGLGTKHGIRPRNCVGVIDPGYVGEILVTIEVSSDEDVLIEKGDRFAQLVIMPFFSPVFLRKDTLESSSRGSGGFGSTGTK